MEVIWIVISTTFAAAWLAWIGLPNARGGNPAWVVIVCTAAVFLLWPIFAAFVAFVGLGALATFVSVSIRSLRR